MLLAGVRRRHAEEEGESVFVSMTDLTVSFLFIVLILLAFFATQFEPDEMVPRDRYEAVVRDLSEVRTELAAAREQIRALEASLANARRQIDDLEMSIANLENPVRLAAYLQGVSQARDDLLKRMTKRIGQQLPGIRVTVDIAAGVIRFRGDDLFEPGQWRIEPGSTAHRMSQAVADALADTLPCYTLGPRSAFYVTCNSAFALIETIQVEGHTDHDPLSPTTQARENMKDNYDLSARRGAETLRFVHGHRSEIGEFRNRREQPVLSFAGYGETRPIASGQTEQGKAENRRIDIRFILHTPQRLREVNEIRRRLTQNRPGLPPVASESVP